MGFTSASEIALTRKSMVKLSTGSSELDKVLGGGIETGRCAAERAERRSPGARASSSTAAAAAAAAAATLGRVSALARRAP
jgi:hypothetical protein